MDTDITPARKLVEGKEESARAGFRGQASWHAPSSAGGAEVFEYFERFVHAPRSWGRFAGAANGCR